MQIYLPIAEIAVHAEAIILLGFLTGILSGLFGIGGGFLTSPLLIFLGIAPQVAVATSANQIIASSFSGFLAHRKRSHVDFHMGFLLLLGGMTGSYLGVGLFHLLQKLGQIDLIISLLYVIFLGTVGSLMAWESWKATRKHGTPSAPIRQPAWIQRLPLRTKFLHSDIELSALAPLAVGLIAGVLVSLMGIGGGFLLIPAMIYLFAMPTSLVVGTSLFQMTFVTIQVTLMQAMSTRTVDLVLACLLLLGAVIGAQMGSRLGMKIPAGRLRGFLSIIILCVAAKLAYGLFVKPPELYSVTFTHAD